MVSEIVAEIETETKLMLAWLGNVERRQRSFIVLEIVEEKETETVAETRKVEETETKLRFPLVALDPPWRALGAKKEAAARLWFGKQSASVLRCSHR